MHQAALDMSNFNQTVGGLSGGSSGTTISKISSGSSTVGTTTLSLNFASTANGGTPYTFSGLIMDGNSTGIVGAVRTVALTKQGTGTQILSAANTFSGATSVQAGVLKHGIKDALGSGTVGITGGTLDLATFTDSVGAITFSGSGGGTLKMVANQTGTAQLVSTDAVNFGAGNTIDLTGMATGAGRYKLVSGTGRTGTFGTVTGLSSNYTLVYGTTSLDAQHKANQTFTGSAGTGRALVNTTVGFSGTLTNTAPTDSANLAVSLTGLSGAASSAGSSVAAQGTSNITGNIAVGGTAGTVNWSVTNTDGSAITTAASVNGSFTAVNQRSFNTSTGTIALGRFLAGTSPSGSVDVSSSGLNAVTANATLGSFTATNTNGLTLGLSNGSGIFNGGTAEQTATYALGGTASVGAISGSFSSPVTAELGSISNVGVNVTGTAVGVRTVLGTTTNLGTYHAGASINVASNAIGSSYGGGTGAFGDTESATVAAINQTDANGINLTGSQVTMNTNGTFTRNFSGTAAIGTGSGTFSSNVDRELSADNTVATNYTVGVYSGFMRWSGGSGSYGTSGNWTDSVAGGAPVAAGLDGGFTGVDTATFNGAGGTVSLDGASPNLNAITFATGDYTLAQGSNGSITMAGTTPSITSTTGNNFISAPITLAANTSVTTTAGTLTIDGNIGETGGARTLTKLGNGTLVLNGNNSYTGPTYVNAGTLKLGATGSLSSVVTTSGTGSLNVSDVVGGYTIANSEIVNIGSGTTSTGAFNVDGELKVNGTLTGNQLITSGGLLSGSGTIDGNVSFADGSIHGPGNSPGIQTITGDVNYAGTTFLWDLVSSSATSIRGTDYDGVDIGGIFTGNGTAVFTVVLAGAETFSDSFWTTNHSWTGIFTADNSIDLNSIFDSFDYFQGATPTPSGPGILGSFSFSGNTLNYTIAGDPIPEPSSALFGLLIGAGLLRRRRAA